MARVKPFKGLRPPRELVTKVASRPYDVLNSKEAKADIYFCSELHFTVK